MTRKLVLSFTAIAALTLLAFGSSESDEDKAARLEREAQEQAAEAAADAEREAAVAEAEASSTETTTMTLRAEINRRKRNGKHWDVMKGAPDPEVKVTVKRTGRVLVSEPDQDSFSAMATFGDVKVNPGDELMLVLNDSDLGMSDKVGQCTITYTAGGAESCDMGSGYLAIEFR